jgi:iron complex outermembrane receptor protein
VNRNVQASIALMLAMCIGSVARGQSAGSPAAADSLAEIVVTAQKRQENLQDVPIAITALSGNELQSSGVGSTTDLGLVTPGLTVVNAAGFIFPHIRGVGTTAFGPGLENSVATYLDGVYLSSGLASLMTLNNVAQIEVLKGPQGTLFGRNATGGLIQITTKDPQSTFSGDADIGYGNYQTETGDLYVTGPVAANLAADIAVHASTQGEGYGRNLFNGEDVYKTDRDIAARSKWKWTPSEATSLALAVDYEETAGSNSSTFVAAPGATNLFRYLGVVPPAPAMGPYDIDNDFQPYDTFKGGGVNLRLLQDVGFAQLQSISAYRRSQYSVGFDADGTPAALETIPVVHQVDTQYSEEINLTSTAPGRVQWVAGLFYLYADAQYDPSEVLLGPPLQVPLPVPGLPPIDQIDIYGKQTTNAYAGYAQTTLAITDNDHLTLGARYSQERRGLEATEPAFLVGGIPIGSLIPQLNDSATFRRPTYRVSLDHNFDPQVMAYLSFNTGFKSGGFNVGVPTDPAYRPEVLYAYEAGLKTKFLDDRLRFNTATYYYNYKDIQVSHFVLGQVGYYNGAAAKIYGVDSDLEAVIAPGLSVTAGLSLIHDYFSDFPNAVSYTPVPVFTPTPSLLTLASANGHSLPLTPSATYNLGADYRHPLATGEANLDVTFEHSDGYAFSPDNILRQGPYNALNASLAWSTADKGLTVTLWGKNLTNDVVANAFLSSAIGSLAAYRPPRTFGILIGTKF